MAVSRSCANCLTSFRGESGPCTNPTAAQNKAEDKALESLTLVMVRDYLDATFQGERKSYICHNCLDEIYVGASPFGEHKTGPFGKTEEGEGTVGKVERLEVVVYRESPSDAIPV